MISTPRSKDSACGAIVAEEYGMSIATFDIWDPYPLVNETTEDTDLIA